MKKQLTEIKRMIEELTKDNKAVKTLVRYKGIGIMTAARNYVLFNPDLHLAGYYRKLVKEKMKKTDVLKRLNPP